MARHGDQADSTENLASSRGRAAPVIDSAVVCGLLVIVATVAAPAAAVSLPAQEPARIITGSRVHLRQAPSIEVPIVGTMALGAEVTALERADEGRWLRVRAGDGTEGWVVGWLTLEIPPGDRYAVIRRLIENRLSRTSDGFPARRELVDFVERVAPEFPGRDEAAEMALLRLRALREAGRTCRDRGSNTSDLQFRAWLEEHTDLIICHELAPGILRRDAILAEADRHAGTRAADRMTYLMVENGLPGECEGDLPCYIDWANRLAGEYLRRMPSGIHVRTVLRNLFANVPYWRSRASVEGEPSPNCERFGPAFAELRAAVDGSEPNRFDTEYRVALLEALDALGGVCR